MYKLLYLCLAVTGLVHFIVPTTIGHASQGKARQADIAPMAITEAVVVLNARDNRDRKLGIQDVVNVALTKFIVGHESDVFSAETPIRKSVLDFLGILSSWKWRLPLVFFDWGKGEWSRNSWRDDHLLFSNRLDGSVSERREIPVSVLLGGRAEENFSYGRQFDGWRFSIVYDLDVDRHRKASFDDGFGTVIRSPDIRALLNLKLGSVIRDVLAQHATLPSSDPGIEQHGKKRKSFQPNFYGFTSSIFITFGAVLGSICLALGVVLGLFFYWRMNRYGSANQYFVFPLGLAASASLFVFGQWMLFSALGLVP
jgi:hypothetical protein